MNSETPIVFECCGEQLVGILHAGACNSKTGVVIVVGGPQYRVGSHRQFVLMARSIAGAGYPVLRFDYRGMGDAGGEFRSFDDVDEDIRSSIDQFSVEVPTVEQVVLLGLCDAASANLIYAAGDDRVRGLILLNPWVRSQQGEARAYLKHYYLRRLLHRSFWRKVFSGEYALIASLREFLSSVAKARTDGENAQGMESQTQESFTNRMLTGFQRYEYPVLVQISGRDLTASEFLDLCEADGHWRRCMDRRNVQIREFPAADHTMSAREQLQDSIENIVDWIGSRIDTVG